jgi:hypothetical protein
VLPTTILIDDLTINCCCALTAHGGSSRIGDSIGSFFWGCNLHETVTELHVSTLVMLVSITKSLVKVKENFLLRTKLPFHGPALPSI